MAPTPGPFVLLIPEVVGRVGVQRQFTVDGPLTGLSVADSRIEDDASIEVDVVVESTTDGSVTARGVAVAPYRGVCRRCLQPLADTMDVDFDEVFEPRPDEGQTYKLDGEWLDLTPMLREALLLALPVAPLCDEACPGPAPEHFPVTVSVDPDDDAVEPVPPADPRWAALGDLRFD